MSLRCRAVALAPALLTSMIPLLLAGCELGPNFFSPAQPEVTGYTTPGEKNLPPEGAGRRTTQHLAIGAKIEDEWWTIFRSPALDAVMKQALSDSSTLAQAQAQLAAAREQVIATAGGLQPQLDIGASVGRQQFNAQPSGVNRTPIPVNLYSIGPTVSYALDVFGGLKRQVEAKEAGVDLGQYQLAAAYLTLTGNVAIQAITIASIREEIKTVERIIADDQKNVDLVKKAVDGGTSTLVDLTSAQSQLANDRTLLAPLHQRLSVARHALAVFAGKVPSGWAPPDFDLAGLPLPHVVPVSLPSELVRQRPDILAAEANLHIASANIGVATANLYPQFTLTANVIQGSTDLGNFFSGIYTGYAMLGTMTAPIFHGGTLAAQQRAAYAAFDAAFASYKQTVIQAFGQVADSLQALVHDDEDVKAQTAAVAIAAEALRLARLSFQEGNTTLLQVLDAERQFDRANIGLVQARSRRVLDTAQLYVALGSGWWNTPPTPPTPPTPQKPG